MIHDGCGKATLSIEKTIEIMYRENKHQTRPEYTKEKWREENDRDVDGYRKETVEILFQ